MATAGRVIAVESSVELLRSDVTTAESRLSAVSTTGTVTAASLASLSTTTNAAIQRLNVTVSEDVLPRTLRAENDLTQYRDRLLAVEAQEALLQTSAAAASMSEYPLVAAKYLEGHGGDSDVTSITAVHLDGYIATTSTGDPSPILLLLFQVLFFSFSFPCST
jgi:hypothetical protein